MQTTLYVARGCARGQPFVKKSASWITAASLSIASVALLWIAIRSFAEWFAHTSSSDKPAVISALGLVAVAIVTYVFNRGADRRRILEELTRRQKIRLYRRIVQYLMSILIKAPNVPPPTDEETQDFIAETTPLMLTYGSNNVVKLWGRFVRATPNVGQMDPWDVVVLIEGVLKAMRKDIGHGSLSLQDGDLARLFITDIDEQVALRKTKQ